MQAAVSKRTEFKCYQFSLCIVRHPQTGKFLAVDESKDRGWWIPGGAVDAGQTFKEAAVRECQEEAGIDIKLKGVIHIDHHLFG